MIKHQLLWLHPQHTLVEEACLAGLHHSGFSCGNHQPKIFLKYQMFRQLPAKACTLIHPHTYNVQTLASTDGPILYIFWKVKYPTLNKVTLPVIQVSKGPELLACVVWINLWFHGNPGLCDQTSCSRSSDTSFVPLGNSLMREASEGPVCNFSGYCATGAGTAGNMVISTLPMIGVVPPFEFFQIMNGIAIALGYVLLTAAVHFGS